MPINADVFVLSYIETALRSSTDGDGVPLDGDKYSNVELSVETQAKFVTDCAMFRVMAKDWLYGKDDSTFAHDFWLTRNGHGTGFWDGDYPEPQANALTDIAHSFGECDLYVGDDGKIYC
jgi:hypothetical protein